MKFPMAMYCAVSPTRLTVWIPVAGIIVNEVRLWDGPVPVPTVRVAVPTTEPFPPAAVIVVVPGLTAVASPEELIVAMLCTLEDQIT